MYPDQHMEPYHVAQFVENENEGLAWLTAKANAIGGLIITEGTIRLSTLTSALTIFCFQSRVHRRVRSHLNYFLVQLISFQPNS